MTTIDAIPTAVLDAVRTTGTDVRGIAAESFAAAGGEQLRCCLRAARAGEALLLFGYAPPLPPSPYATSTAVFAHAQPCERAGTGYPQDWRDKPQVFRAYDRRGWIHPSTRVFDGTGDPDVLLADVLAEPTVEQVHVHNIGYGCFVLRVTR